ncbi:MAG: TRAP transporter small permease subunit [Spirochaetota bacterium]
MHRAIKSYVHSIDKMSRATGRYVMFMVLGMMGILLFEAIMRTVFNRPHIWAVEFAQFVMAAYYTLGGAYSHLIEGHVRMDIFYHRWSPRRKAVMDAITFLILAFYLVVLLHGAVKGIIYAVEYKQVSYSAWSPVLYPIKIIMTIGIIMMFLQSISEFFKDLARVRGEEISEGDEPSVMEKSPEREKAAAGGSASLREVPSGVKTAIEEESK